jgi:ubiquinone/menaquinone biosynthesis C-methylase UbiE
MQNILYNDPRVDFFNNNAPNWDTCGPDINVTLSRLRQIQNRLCLLPGMNLLEVGCGTGQITTCLAEWVNPGKVVSIDFSPSMIKIA